MDQIQEAGRFVWNLTVILIKVPIEPGVYSIWEDEVCLYVGESRDLLSRLVMHYKNIDQMSPGKNPTSFRFEIYRGKDRVSRRDALNAELKPTFSSVVA